MDNCPRCNHIILDKNYRCPGCDIDILEHEADLEEAAKHLKIPIDITIVGQKAILRDILVREGVLTPVYIAEGNPHNVEVDITIH